MSAGYTVSPGGSVSGCLQVPGDKSMSHRSIMLGALAEGTTRIKGFLRGADALATINAFQNMGVVISDFPQDEVHVEGVGLHGLKMPEDPLYVGNAGTAMRLIAGIMAAQKFCSTITGDHSLSNRPMGRIVTPLRQMGALIQTEASEKPPLYIKGNAALRAIDYTLPVASAQVKSCLLLAGLYARGTTTVTEPGHTRDHTERMLRAFGYPVDIMGNRVRITGGHRLKATTVVIPADISSAAFFMVAASIADGSDILLANVGINPTRDGVIRILRQMGADIQLLDKRVSGDEPVADIRVRSAPLKGIDIPLEFVPLAIDEFPALFIAAACAEGTTRLTGAEELRVKESDRIYAMAKGLGALGIRAIPAEDGIEITGGVIAGGEVDSFHDHRIAMAFAVAGLRAEATVKIHNCRNVATSFPDFVPLAKKAGINIACFQ